MPHHANSTTFQKGHETWNKGFLGYHKGRKHSAETKARMSLIAKAKWEEGRMPSRPRVRVPVTCEVCQSEYAVIPSRVAKTHYCSSGCYAKAKERRPSWNKGKFRTNTYGANHHKVRTIRVQPSLCEICGTTTAKKFEWANMTGHYEDVNDYKRMCASCHDKHDGIIKNIAGTKKPLSKSLSSHP